MSRPIYGKIDKESICNMLKDIINETGHFPRASDLRGTQKCSLENAISKNGGFNYFRKILNIPITQESPRTITFDFICNKIKIVQNEIGRFPTITDLKKLGRWDIIKHASSPRFGGYARFREHFGVKNAYNPIGFWNNQDTRINELKNIIETIGHFPSALDLQHIGRHDLANAISRFGGYVKHRELLGLSITEHDKYISKKCSYTTKRGKKTERLIKTMIYQYCQHNNLPIPELNKKFSDGSIIEFVCNTGRRIGIDVINVKQTRNNARKDIRRKYIRKDYHKYLDELWIVAFSSVLKNDDYTSLNQTSPENVKIMSVDTFMNEIKYTADKYMVNEIESYKKCTFHTKDECTKLINRDKQNIDYWSSQKYTGI